MESEFDMEKPEKLKLWENEKWCSYRQTNGCSDKECFQQMRK